GAEGDRLRRGEGGRAAVDGEDAVHSIRGTGRHVRVHEPRAGRDERLRRGHPQRHLRAGRAALRTADRLDTTGASAAAGRGVQRDRPTHQGRGAAETEPSPEYIRHAGEGGRGAQDRAGEVVAAPEGRARLGRHEVPGEGPITAVRHGERAGEGRGTVPDGPAGGNAAAVGAVSASEDRPAGPGWAHRGPRGGGGGARRGWVA